MLRAALLAIFLLVPFTLPALAAQQNASDMMLDPADLGSDWTIVAERELAPSIGSGLTSGSARVVAGPRGARALIAVFMVEPTPATARRMWQFGNELFDETRSKIDFDYGSEREAAALPPPQGCDDVRRSEGRDRLFDQAFPVGLTLCAADPDAIIFVTTNGTVLGQSGHAAADAVVELMFAHHRATPISSPRGIERATVAEPDNPTAPLADLLPTVDGLPAGFSVLNEGDRSEADVVAALGDTQEAATLLADWGWAGNSFRDFSLNQEASPGATIYYSVSINRFADPESAENALTYFADYVVEILGLADVEVPPVGESVRALNGAPEGVAFTVLYIQQGSLLYRIAGSANSEGADPTDDVVAFAQAVVPLEVSVGVATPDSAVPPSPHPDATPTDATAQPAEVTITSLDIYFDPNQLTIPANQNVVIHLLNAGASHHNFSIDVLNISVDQAPGETNDQLTINAAPGEYQFYCNVPGHKEAGMVGTLTVQ